MRAGAGEDSRRFACRVQVPHVRRLDAPEAANGEDVRAPEGRVESAVDETGASVFRWRLPPGRLNWVALDLTSAWDGLDKGEPFHLLNHGAQDVRGYDCVKDLVLAGRYSCEWRPYSNLGGQRGEFRYLALEVTSDAIATNIESS